MMNDSTVRTPDAYCAVCTVAGRSDVIMIPCASACPDEWREEYSGYLMSQHNFNMKRTQFVCVDGRPDIDESTEGWGKGGFLHFIEPVCRKSGNITDQMSKNTKLECVVCTI